MASMEKLNLGFLLTGVSISCEFVHFSEDNVEATTGAVVWGNSGLQCVKVEEAYVKG